MGSGSNPPDPGGDALDLFIIGGGINGCGIARDAAGRGLTVALAEMNDLGSATSSASTKLFHGGLRYLEYFEFRLVREALKEREVLLLAMPHIAWPMRFVLPLHQQMRFDSETPASRLLSLVMPWMKGRRPAWLIRLGLFLYDHMGQRRLLPPTSALDLRGRPEGEPLKQEFVRAYEYSDCWVQDSRLVVLNARGAADAGAKIMTRTRVTQAERGVTHWTIHTKSADGSVQTFRARCIVNAGGPWVSQVLTETLGIDSAEHIRLVRGSHIVVRKLYDHQKCYFLQGTDGRIIFLIPYEDDFTLIGTTDQDHAALDEKPTCSEAEADYLRTFASSYLRKPIAKEDIVWTYSGVRPLYDDGASSATAATREYVLSLDGNQAPLLSVFGGKITTHRKLAEAALAKIAPFFPTMGNAWTARAPLPGGDFPIDGAVALAAGICRDHPFVDEALARRLVRTYGTDARRILSGSKQASDLGEDFGAGITARELDWTIGREWVRNADDFLWRRTKLGLRMLPDQAQAIDDYIRHKCRAVTGGDATMSNSRSV